VSTGRQVLVVDDDEGVRTAVTWALQADGFEVLAVDNGLAAMDVIESTLPALVVLDLSLPGLGGLDILRRLRAIESRTGRSRLPIIVLSGRDSETDRIVGLDLGADDYLVKPFSPGELAASARSLLRRCTEPTSSGQQGWFRHAHHRHGDRHVARPYSATSSRRRSRSSRFTTLP
jgi:two-component system, OmpR family, phosphate regulon response regulator PhoB